MGTSTLLALLAAVACISSASALSDGASLLAAKEAWGLNYSSWQGDDPCTSWKGVQCDDNQRVTYLNLSNSGIVGPIPSEIGNLEHLTSLDLSNARNSKPPFNRISGDLSPLGALSSLLSLNISFNHIELNTFPVVLFKLTNLISMRIDNNAISGPLPKELAKFTKIKYLYLGNNSFTGPIPQELSSLANLEELSLWNNNLQSKIPPEFGNLAQLRYLNLHDCNLYGGLPPELGNLKNMQNISLFRNQLTGTIPDTWSNLKSLRNLFLYNNYLTKHIPSWLLDLPNLYNVSIGYNLFYGDLNLQNTKVPIVAVTCNFFSGAAPTPPSTMLLNSTGNCFLGSDPDAKIKCIQSPYYNCNSFLQAVPNGSCPVCPPLQYPEDATSCVCTRDPITGGSSSHLLGKLVGSIVGVGAFLAFVLVIWWKRSRTHKGSAKGFWEGPEGVQRFHYRDLSRATSDFNSSHEIGRGGFGKVFWGVVDGRKVAIKRAHSTSIQSSSGFRNEVMLLSRLHHRNLVHLVGFCEEDGIQILVYEHMPNGNLHTLLFKNQRKIELDWLRRLDIALGVAQGLDYLHSFADPPVIHRDVKPSNILLDDNLAAKLSDFGISKVASEFETQFATRPAGTVGYIDPQYILREHLTTASDVYSFGMVLLELISGQKSIDNTRLDEHNLVEWAKLKLNREGLKCIVDSQLGNRYPESIYHDIVRLGIDCASFNSESRPSMKAVVSILGACRWSVTPHLLQVTEDTLETLYGDETDGHSFTESSQRALAKEYESSFAEGSSSTFSASLLLPR